MDSLLIGSRIMYNMATGWDLYGTVIDVASMSLKIEWDWKEIHMPEWINREDLKLISD